MWSIVTLQSSRLKWSLARLSKPAILKSRHPSKLSLLIFCAAIRSVASCLLCCTTLLSLLQLSVLSMVRHLCWLLALCCEVCHATIPIIAPPTLALGTSHFTQRPDTGCELPSCHGQVSRRGLLCRGHAGDRIISRRSSLTDDRVDEVINNLTNMHSMVKLLRESSVDKPDAARTWDVRLLIHSPASPSQ